MIYLLKILIITNIISFSRSALFLFKRNVNLSSLSLILSQTFSILIWLNIFIIILDTPPSGSHGPPIAEIGTQFVILILFWTHKTSEQINIKISNFGLFRFIRYPLFTIYLLSYFSIFWLYKDTTGLVFSLFMTLIYHIIGRNRDSHMLNSELSEEYQEYMNKTGILTPNLLGFFLK